MYKAIVVSDSDKTKIMASEIEATANEQELNGYRLISVSISKSGKAIMIFYRQVTIKDGINSILSAEYHTLTGGVK